MKSNKKIIFILLGIILLLIILMIILNIVLNKEVSLVLKDDLNVDYNEKITNLSFVKEVKNGIILTKEEKIDTSKIGIKEIKLKLENKLRRKQNFTFKINIMDVVAPIITYNEKITITEGEQIDLLKDVKVIDDVDKDIEVTIEGEYDINIPGTYTIYYIAKDTSGNETKEKATLEVKEKQVISNNVSSKQYFTTSKGFKGYTENGVTYIDNVLIVNKTYTLPSSYGTGLTNATLENFNEMKNAANNVGLNISIISGFRSYSYQKEKYESYVNKDGQALADTYSARAGHSEHQSGLAIDINSLNATFGETEEGKWLNDNAYKYGFILRYPNGKESITGYQYEPWHFRYVGIPLAIKLYNYGSWITLEEYFGITSKY